MANKPEGGTAVFVLGLLGLLLCPILGIVAWVMGNTYMGKCRAMSVAPEGIAVAGRILGIISTVLIAIFTGILLVSLSLLFVISDDEALPPSDPQEAGQTVPAGE